MGHQFPPLPLSVPGSAAGLPPAAARAARGPYRARAARGPGCAPATGTTEGKFSAGDSDSEQGHAGYRAANRLGSVEVQLFTSH